MRILLWMSWGGGGGGGVHFTMNHRENDTKLPLPFQNILLFLAPLISISDHFFDYACTNICVL
jgi:hypothetical protein